jgi:hypothetical protein
MDIKIVWVCLAGHKHKTPDEARLCTADLMRWGGIIGIGTRFYGYCNGYFDDDYEDKWIEQLGHDWIVVRNSKGEPLMAHFPGGINAHLKMIHTWTQKER